MLPVFWWSPGWWIRTYIWSMGWGPWEPILMSSAWGPGSRPSSMRAVPAIASSRFSDTTSPSRQKTGVLCYLNLSTLGSVVGPWYGNLSDPRLIDEERIAQTVEAHRDMIIGIKVMATGTTLGSQGMEPLQRVRRLADNLRLPLLIHIGESWGQAPPVALADILKHLRPRDAITHMFTGHPGGLVDANGKTPASGQKCTGRGNSVRRRTWPEQPELRGGPPGARPGVRTGCGLHGWPSSQP